MTGQYRIPPKWLFLDLLGGLLLAIGLIFLIAEPRSFLPWDVDYGEMGTGLLIVGILFMLPLLFHMLLLFRTAASHQKGHPPASD